MFDKVLIISDDPTYYKDIVQSFIPATTSCTMKSFTLLSETDVPTSHRDLIMVVGMYVDKSKYDTLSTLVSKGSTPLFGMDLDIEGDVRDLSIFEHVFQSLDVRFTKTVAITSAANVSFSPPFEPIPTYKHVIGVFSEYLVPYLPEFDFVEYVIVHEANRLHMFGCHGLIVRGMIDNLHDYINVVASCKPVLVLEGNDGREQILAKVSSFLTNDVTWGGKEVEKHARTVWWRNFSTTQKNLVSHVRDLTVFDPNAYVAPVMGGRPKAFIDLDVFANNFSKVHRSGWNYVLRGLLTLQRVGRRNGANMKFDSCVENTFMWNGKSESNKYDSPWIGVIHHTFSEHCGPYNCCTLFTTQNFVESLDHCKGLIVLSEYLARQVRASLTEIGKGSIKVVAVKHPTEFVDKCSSTWAKAPTLDVTKVPLVHIGDFLRNKRAFFGLKTSWKKMLVNTGRSPTDNGGMSADCGVVEIQGFPADVEIVGPLPDSEYDNLLSNCVVFLNLVDASACNTLIECMVRATPVLVNRHPAVIEYIGEDYPGLYDTIEEAEDLLRRPDYIHEMHRFLVGKANTKTIRDLSIQRFVTSVHEFIVDQSTING